MIKTLFILRINNCLVFSNFSNEEISSWYTTTKRNLLCELFVLCFPEDFLKFILQSGKLIKVFRNSCFASALYPWLKAHSFSLIIEHDTFLQCLLSNCNETTEITSQMDDWAHILDVRCLYYSSNERGHGYSPTYPYELQKEFLYASYGCSQF